MDSQSKCGRKKNCAITGPHYHFTPQIEPIVEWNNCRTKWMRSGDKNLSQLWLLQQCTHKSQIIIKKEEEEPSRQDKNQRKISTHTHKKIETKTAYKVSFFSLFSAMYILNSISITSHEKCFLDRWAQSKMYLCIMRYDKSFGRYSSFFFFCSSVFFSIFCYLQNEKMNFISFTKVFFSFLVELCEKEIDNNNSNVSAIEGKRNEWNDSFLIVSICVRAICKEENDDEIAKKK